MGGAIDLHSHSTASDGTLSPTEVVSRAHAAGVHTLALTDHDTLAGLEEARCAAIALGMQFVNGVEISTRWRTHTIHVIALDVDTHCSALCEGLAALQAQRRIRAAAIAEKLEKFGLRDALARARRAAAGGQITRAHFARLLVEDRHCRTTRAAFKRLLGAGKSAHVPCSWVALPQAIEWICAAGGQAVLAHPLLYHLSATQLNALVSDFATTGGHAVEVCSGAPCTAAVTRAAALASRHHLYGSVGSDFHDPAQTWRRLGGTAPLPHSVAPVWQQFRSATLAS